MPKKTSTNIIDPVVDPVKPELPQLTFTEEEHKALVDYMNFVSSNCKISDVTIEQSHKFSVTMIKAIGVVKKIEAHIFEFKRKMK